MNEVLHCKLLSGEILQPRLVSHADLYDMLSGLFPHTFESLDDVRSACIQDLFVWDFNTPEEKTGVEYARQCISQVSQHPRGMYHVFVLLGIDCMTELAVNVLLKTFEDIEPYTLFLMTSTTSVTLMPTIRSRIIIQSQDRGAVGISPELQAEVTQFVSGSYFPLLKRILKQRLERRQCLDIVHLLQKEVTHGNIGQPDIISQIAKVTEYLSSSNAAPRNQLDTVLFQLLLGSK